MKRFLLATILLACLLAKAESANDVYSPFLGELAISNDTVIVSVLTNANLNAIKIGNRELSRQNRIIKVSHTNEVLHLVKRHEWMSIRCVLSDDCGSVTGIQDIALKPHSALAILEVRKTYPAYRNGYYHREYYVVNKRTLTQPSASWEFLDSDLVYLAFSVHEDGQREYIMEDDLSESNDK